MDLWVRLHHLDLVLKVNWAVTFHLKLLVIRLTNRTSATHIDEIWKELVLLRVDNWKRMDWDQNLVSVAMDPHRVIIVLIFIGRGGELDVDVLGDAGRNHAFFLILYFEVASLWWQNMQSLRRWGVVN